MKKLKAKVSLVFLLVVMLVGTCFAGRDVYEDIEDTEYETSVYALHELGIMAGYPDDTFKPFGTVTRAEMVKMLVSAYGLGNLAKANQSENTGFADVNMKYVLDGTNKTSNHWASGYIYVAKDYGFIDEATNFYPDNKITYADAITFCVRILGYKDEVESKGSRPNNYISKAQNLKLLKGLEINSYSDSATRGNIAILLWNVMNTKMWENSSQTSKTFMQIKYPNKVEDVEAIVEELNEILPTGIELPSTSKVVCLGIERTKIDIYDLVNAKVLPKNATKTQLSYGYNNNTGALKIEQGGFVVSAQKLGESVISIRTINGIEREFTVNVVDHEYFDEKEFKYDDNNHWELHTCSYCGIELGKENIEKHTFVNGKCKCGKTSSKTSVEALEFETDIMNLKVGDTKQLKLKITPDEANEKITYTSDAESYVSVKSNGKIKALKNGKLVTITAKSESGKTATCKVVVPEVTVCKMVLGTSSDKEGLNKDDLWVSTDESVVAFEGEKYVAKKLGKSTLTAYLKDNPDIVTAKIEVEVVETLGSMSIEVKGEKNYTLEVGEKIDLEAEIISTVENNDGSGYKLTWKSSDSNIATVKGNNRKAKLTAKNLGTCDVVVSCEGMQSTIKIKVIDFNVSSEYDDVKKNDWFEEPVKYVTNNNLMNGIGDNKFSPSTNMTRGMMVTVLYRMSKSSYDGKSTFADVKESEYYSSAVAWAAENEIVNGIGDNKFAPDEKITREQLIVILYRYAKFMEINVNAGENTNILSYDDSNEIAEYSISAFQWGCGEGIISGRTTTTLSPKETASRAEVATMLMRFMEN